VTPEPRQSLGEEIANSVSHGVGLLAAAAAVPFLIRAALQIGGIRTIVGAGVFAATLLLLYVSSTVYHALPPNRAKRVFRMLDYGAVFLLIAGTYTPFTLGVLHGGWGWTLLGLVWSLAILGIALTTLGGLRHQRLIVALYVLMGWLIVIAIRPLWLRMPAVGFAWLAAGGVAYAVGVAFLTTRRMRYSHLVWHLLVLVGTACHFIAVYGYAT
jgi:hemolysin III